MPPALPRQKVEEMQLYEIDRSPEIGLLTALYVPPLAADTSFENFQEIVARLRAPDGCPWDREQTHLTLRKYLLEETYEALAVLDGEDAEGMREEFGDLLLQIVLHAQIGSEEGEFSMAEILQGISQKLVRRHPHVFGDVEVDGVNGVLQNWEKLKAVEKKDNGDQKHRGLLEGVPKEFPALAQAQQVQDRASRVGFDWAGEDEIWDELARTMQALKAGSARGRAAPRNWRAVIRGGSPGDGTTRWMRKAPCGKRFCATASVLQVWKIRPAPKTVRSTNSNRPN